MTINQIIKTKGGTKAWRIRRIEGDTLILEGVTNGKPKQLTVEQFNKSWTIDTRA